MVVHDAVPQHHLHRHQQRLAPARPVLCLPHHQGGNQTWVSDKGGDKPAYKRDIQEKKLRTHPRPLHLLHLHGTELDGHEQPHGRKPADLLRRSPVDKDTAAEDRGGVQHPPAGSAGAYHQKIQRHGGERETAARAVLRKLQERHKGDSETVRHQQKRYVASIKT